jgi:hypothetical protein
MIDRDRVAEADGETTGPTRTARAWTRQIGDHVREAAEGDLLDDLAVVDESAGPVVADDELQRRVDAAHRREASEADLLADAEPAIQDAEPTGPRQA